MELPDDPLHELVAAAVELLETEGEGGLERFCREHPAESETIRSRVRRLAEVGLLGAAPTKPPERLGEFRLLRPLGEGGMGIVYVAEQPRLGREVALKIIRPEQIFFPAARLRFQREVETVAKLRHPGIVPIYTVGEDHGVPYFAMELLRGSTLEAALRKLAGRAPESLTGRDLSPDAAEPGYLYAGTWEEAALRVIGLIADALQHAHSRGVVHRDIKPSNLFLTADGTSRVVLLDFGLAASRAVGALTQSGSRLGSLSYMSPEQARGDSGAATPRSDVYSLGVTLYELLTLRTAFEGRSETELLAAIERGAPKRIRERNRAVSWEAETVCMTAMELDPARRYASAADFARDLENVLARRPIEARRVGALRRAHRWTQRNPAKAVALALAFALTVGLPSTLAWQERNASLKIAEQRDRAERNFEHALEAVDRMLTRVADKDLAYVPQMTAVRKAVLEDAVKLLERFVADEGSSARARREVGAAHGRIGRLLSELGRYADARSAFASAVEVLRDDPKAFDLLATMRMEQATALGVAGDTQAALAVCDLVDAQLAEEEKRGGDPRKLQRMRARSLFSRGSILSERGSPDAARPILMRASEEADRLLEMAPDAVESREIAAQAWNAVGLLLIRVDTPEGTGNPDAEAALERTVALEKELCAREPENPNYRQMLATARINLAGALRRGKSFDRAGAVYREAREGLQDLVAKFPESISHKVELATVSNQLGLLQEVLEPPGDPEAYYRETVTMLREVTSRAPLEPVLWTRFAEAQVNLSSPLRLRKEFDEAIALVQGAIAADRKAIELSKDAETARVFLASHWKILGMLHRWHGDHAEAVAADEEMARTLPKDPRNGLSAALQIGLLIATLPELPLLSPEEAAALRVEYGDRAIALIREVLKLGVTLPMPLRKFQDLEALHGLDSFEQLARELEPPPK